MASKISIVLMEEASAVLMVLSRPWSGLLAAAAASGSVI